MTISSHAIIRPASNAKLYGLYAGYIRGPRYTLHPDSDIGTHSVDHNSGYLWQALGDQNTTTGCGPGYGEVGFERPDYAYGRQTSIYVAACTGQTFAGGFRIRYKINGQYSTWSDLYQFTEPNVVTEFWIPGPAGTEADLDTVSVGFSTNDFTSIKEITVFTDYSPLAILEPQVNEKFCFTSDSPGTLDVVCEANLDDPNLTWSVTPKSDPCTQVSWSVNPPRGKTVTLHFEGLPESNNFFGDWTVTATLGSETVSVDFQIFFPALATNNGSVNGDPNWFYYWTKALYNNANEFFEPERFTDAGDGAPVTIVYWDPLYKFNELGQPTTTEVRGKTLFQSDPNVCTPNLTHPRTYFSHKCYVNDGSLERHAGVNYIDAYGYLLAHELWHQQQQYHNYLKHDGLRPGDGYQLNTLIDIDTEGGDNVCDKDEEECGWSDPEWHAGGWEAKAGLIAMTKYTHLLEGIHFYDETGQEVFIRDDEYGAMKQESNFQPSAAAYDWAAPGSQWPNYPEQ